MSAAETNERLWGLPGAERMHSDVAELWEADIEPYTDVLDERRSRFVEEWTVCPPSTHLLSPSDLLYAIHERVHDDGELTLDGGEDYFNENDPKLLAAAQTLLDAIAETVTWRQADERIATHVVSWDVDGNPKCDGEPIYAGGES